MRILLAEDDAILAEGLLRSLRRTGHAVDRVTNGGEAQLVDPLCEWGDAVSASAIEMYVHRLRRKLESEGVSIRTIRGLGYCIEKAAAGPSLQPSL